MAARKKKATKKAVRKKAPARKKAKTSRKKGPGTGMTPFVPTDEMRHLVCRLRSHGFNQQEISHIIINPRTGKHIALETLKAHFAHELEHGAPIAQAKVAETLFEKAISKDHPQAATAAIWYTKSRMGWKSHEQVSVDVESKAGVLVAPTAISLEDWVAAQAAANAKKESPEDE